MNLRHARALRTHASAARVCHSSLCVCVVRNFVQHLFNTRTCRHDADGGGGRYSHGKVCGRVQARFPPKLSFGTHARAPANSADVAGFVVPHAKAHYTYIHTRRTHTATQTHAFEYVLGPSWKSALYKYILLDTFLANNMQSYVILFQLINYSNFQYYETQHYG